VLRLCNARIPALYLWRRLGAAPALLFALLLAPSQLARAAPAHGGSILSDVPPESPRVCEGCPGAGAHGADARASSSAVMISARAPPCLTPLRCVPHGAALAVSCLCCGIGSGAARLRRPWGRRRPPSEAVI
jgi:hypothetical protein